MPHRDTSVAIKQAHIRSVPNAWVGSQPLCFNEDSITLYSNQSRVSLSTDVFEVFMLQVKVNRHYYNCYAVIYIHDLDNHVLYCSTSKIVVIKMYVIIYISHDLS